MTLNWPSTFLLRVMSTHTKYDFNWSFPYQVIMVIQDCFTSDYPMTSKWPQHFVLIMIITKTSLSSIKVYPIALWCSIHNLTSIDPWWPNNVLLIIMNIHTEYELYWSFPYQVMDFKIKIDLMWPPNDLSIFHKLWKTHAKCELYWSFPN